MSNYKLRRSKEHEVIHEFSGKYHFFKVISENSEHEVSLQINCDCQYMSVQGHAQGKICSHVLSVLQKIVDKGEININNNNIKQMKINSCLNLVRESNRKVNEIRISPGESKKHQDMKIDICMKLAAEGKSFITEAIFENGGRADILILEDFQVIEIAHSETDKSIEHKKQTYPRDLKLMVVRI